MMGLSQCLEVAENRAKALERKRCRGVEGYCKML